MVKICKLLGLAALVEMHDEREFDRVLGIESVELIGINNLQNDIAYMVKICKLLGLAALVEMHDEREFDRVLGIESVELIGINNLQNDIAVSHQ
ncbi:hypothetical protein KIW84_033059 [Lathyrus oleraceus]|uniref:Indole-3-glycerol-phosphate synthase n=1 Tax=Pisum sativum TaxID=3888 RepID=A0A9D5AZG6_PEA|nr:hypothetical protein KIW84_033059 [Pisum sativum]